MSIGLILAIIELILKLPAIIQFIKDILASIHRQPFHLHAGLITELEAAVKAAHALHDAGQPGQAFDRIQGLTMRFHALTHP